MKYVKSNNKIGNVISTKRSDYQVLLDIRYKKIIESYMDSEYKKSIHTENCKESLVYFKLDYYVREFLKEKKVQTYYNMW